ncbi:hypothetical protein [Flavihumibacter sp. CACIAM 22H1]|uniref:hypothetical protein n=1 Tax=Flavihumibacter sp. CACIAM 22H1 TaxID=1812911 RepID=UPI0007A857CF|nr:hypothetical protein [Flavihumibacter sp. CACIAM 22H1]KYP16073.1 MAG: hypothetical protein A1D16_18560 [Flavihumibacter sp. CACIAM 22H1]
MSLNSIKLTGTQLAGLYSSSLVLTGDSARPSGAFPIAEAPAPGPHPETAPTPPPPIQFLGRNSRRFVVLVHYPEAVHISETAFEFLGSVLKACQLNAADIAIVNLAKQTPDLAQLTEELLPELLLNFTGIVPAGLPADTPLLSPTRINSVAYMIAPGLDQLNQSSEAVKPLKRQLWEGLKAMLGI